MTDASRSRSIRGTALPVCWIVTGPDEVIVQAGHNGGWWGTGAEQCRHRFPRRCHHVGDRRPGRRDLRLATLPRPGHAVRRPCHPRNQRGRRPVAAAAARMGAVEQAGAVHRVRLTGSRPAASRAPPAGHRSGRSPSRPCCRGRSPGPDLADADVGTARPSSHGSPPSALRPLIVLAGGYAVASDRRTTRGVSGWVRSCNGRPALDPTGTAEWHSRSRRRSRRRDHVRATARTLTPGWSAAAVRPVDAEERHTQFCAA